MNLAAALGTAAIAAQLCCCTSTESAIAPLGFGPLAKAELAQPERSGPRSKPSRAKASLPRAVTSSTGPASTGGTSSTTAEPSATATPDGAVVAASTAANWVGSWKGKDTTRFQIPSFPSEPMMDDQARIRVEAAGTQEIKFVLIDSSNDQDLCTLSAKLTPPNQALIAPGQACFGSEDDAFELSVHVSSGTATLQGSVLALDVVLDAELTSDQLRGNGTVVYHFEGSH